MKLHFYITAFFLSCLLFDGFAQYTFQKTLQDTSDITIFDIISGSDNSFLTIGSVSDTSANMSLVVVKSDRDANPLWSFKYDFGYLNESCGVAIIESPAYNYLISGIIIDYNNSNKMESFLMKIDSMGNKKWVKIYKGPWKFHPAINFIQTREGGCVLSGDAYHNTSSIHESYAYILKTESNGNPLFNIKYFLSGMDTTIGVRSILKTSDSGYLMVGAQSNGIFLKALLIKTDSMGVFERADTLSIGGYNAYLLATTVLETRDKALIIGTLSDLGFIIVKLDSSHNVVWSKSFGTGFNYISKIKQASDGGIIILAFDSLYHKSNMYLIKISENGSLIWERKIGGNERDEAYSFLENSDHGFTIAGNSQGFGNKMLSGLYYVKTDSLGNSGCNNISIQDTLKNISVSIGPLTLLSSLNTYIIDTSIVVVKKPLNLHLNTLCANLAIGEFPNDESLISSLYPNPVQSVVSFIITPSLKMEETLKLIISDLYGKIMKSQEVILPNSSDLKISVSDLPNGVYFLSLEGVTSGRRSVNKIVILR